MCAFALAPAVAGSSGVPAGRSAGAALPVPLSVTPQPPAIGVVSISDTGVSSDPTVVSTSGSTATVLESFNGNITDDWPQSTLNGDGYTVNATTYPSDANVIAVTTSRVVVENLVVSAAGSTDGIFVGSATDGVTVESSVVLFGASTAPVVGIELGRFPAAANEPSGSYTVSGNTVHGPGSGGIAGSTGIGVFGGAVTVTGNDVNGFSAETTSELGDNSFSSWLDDSQSVAIFAGCGAGSTTCTIASNSLSDNAIGVAYEVAASPGNPPFPAGPVTIEQNAIDDSLAYGLVAEPAYDSGTSVITANTVNNTASGAPAAYVLGGAFTISANVFTGTSTSGSNGAEQGQGDCADATIPTAFVEASDCASPTTTVGLNANFFEQPSAPYWTATFPTNPTSSTESGGEVVTFSENGVPAHHLWSLTFAGTTEAILAPAELIADAANGSQSYSIGSVAGYYEHNVPTVGTIDVAGAAVTEPTLEFEALGTGQVVITSGCTSTDPGVIAMSGSDAVLQETFDGNVTDYCPSSELNGAGFTIDAGPFVSDANAVGLGASGITVEDLTVEAAGGTGGIVAVPTATAATVIGSTVRLSEATAATVGIQLGDVFPSTVTEPTGTFLVKETTVDGPGSDGVAGQIGILVAGASVTVANDSVTGFSAETTSTSGGNTYSSWFEDTQSVGIFAGCAEAAAACAITGNSLTGNSIGIVYALLTDSFQSITPSSVTVSANAVADSLAYGFLAEATGASGTSTVSGNSFDNDASGAPGAFLIGADYSVTANTFVGTSLTGSNGASQGEDSCAAGSIGTAAVQASDCFNPTTTVSLNGNLFVNVSSPYWSETFPSNPSTSSELGGEIVSFAETGLVHGTSWALTVAGLSASVTAPAPVAADLANGSSSYSVRPVVGYRLSPSGGPIEVSGAPVTVPVPFVRVSYLVTLHENGLPAETEWGVKINGTTTRSITSAIAVYLPNGTYPYVPGAAGWSARSGTAVVRGAAVELQVNFTQAVYALTFHETGLAAGTEWWVNLTTMASYHSKTATIRFDEPNGTYDFIVVGHNGTKREYTAPGGAVAVVGAAVSEPVAFTKFYPVSFREAALPAGTEWWVNVTGGASHSSTTGQVRFWALPGAYSYTVATADKAFAAKAGAFTIHTAGVARHVRFVKQLFEVTVQETGLPRSSAWCFVITGGARHCTTGLSLTVKLVNGSYAYTLTTRRAGYSATGGTIVVDGADVSRTVTFSG